MAHPRVGTTLSAPCTQTCGVPQGTCSGPVLFILYAESLLRSITPLLHANRAQAGMFADDLTIWKTGPDVAQLAAALSIITDTIVQRTTTSNMILAEEKCETILFTNHAKDPMPRVLVKGFVTPVKDVVRLLGVYLDKGLTFRAHVDHLISTTALRLHQLRAVANSAFGPSQSDLRNMYASYIRSVVEYGALSWYPVLSNTNAERLEIIQNKAARIAPLGVSATDINSLRLEASLLPQTLWIWAITTGHHPTDNDHAPSAASPRSHFLCGPLPSSAAPSPLQRPLPLHRPGCDQQEHRRGPKRRNDHRTGLPGLPRLRVLDGCLGGGSSWGRGRNSIRNAC